MSKESAHTSEQRTRTSEEFRSHSSTYRRINNMHPNVRYHLTCEIASEEKMPHKANEIAVK